MTRQLVFINGRSQEHKDAAQLKEQWIATWAEGLRRSGLGLPISEPDIRFPYYGDTLYDLERGAGEEAAANVIVRGAFEDNDEKEFMLQVMQEVRKKADVTDEQLAAVAGQEVVERGILNHEWVLGIMRALDSRLPGGSGASIALATHDVYEYLRNPGIRDVIETGVRAAFAPGVPTVVVGHSLGSVVAYNLLRRDGAAMGWQVPLFVTVGCPLAVTAIRRALQPVQFPACAGDWYNALDPRDVVALYPLDASHFAVNPPVKNKINVDNDTENRHGIVGYLNDKDVARKIYEALRVRQADLS
jgi:hypothetical protein